MLKAVVILWLWQLWLCIRDALHTVRIRSLNVFYPAPATNYKVQDVSWTMAILWMNLNVIELLIILQLTTIQIGSSGNNIKPHTTIRLVNKSFFGFWYLTFESSDNYLPLAFSSALGPKRLCTSSLYRLFGSTFLFLCTVVWPKIIFS